MSENMLTRKTNEEFRESGMLFLANTILQFFGWSIVIEKDGERECMYAARTKFRGFDEDSTASGHVKVAKFLTDHYAELLDEALS